MSKKVKGKAAIPLYEVLKSIDPKVSPEHHFDWLYMPREPLNNS